MTLQGVKRKIATISDLRFTGRLLGKGNFARVEEAVHSALNVKVAVKIINLQQVKEKYVLKNLHREARLMSMLNHPCIAALFQTMQADDVYYLVTELVAGGDLCSFIIGQRNGKLEERTARIYARQFASALSHMHSFGIVHRDLKMENVMLNSGQTQIKIVDFGLSNTWTGEEPLRTHCGSPEYAAPELFIAGKEYGPEVDLWSIGIIFYGMVVGQLPFVVSRRNDVSSSERRKKLVAHINQGLGTKQRHAIATLSFEFRVMINKLLIADPIKRITAHELLIHPWITEKGRKFVQAHPLKLPDCQWEKKFTRQVADAFRADEKIVAAEIATNPYGRLGAMYNVLRYKLTNAAFNPDKLALSAKYKMVRTKMLTPLVNECYKSEKIIGTEKMEQEKVLVKSKSAPIKIKPQSGLYNQCYFLLNRVRKQQIGDGRTKSAKPALEAFKSPYMTRSRTAKTEGSAKPAKTTSSKVITQSKTGCYVRKSAKSEEKKAEERRRLTKRPNTVSSAPTGNVAAAPNNKMANIKDCNHKLSIPGWERAAVGDTKRSANVVSCKTQARQRLANDPIARSIAGYLVKNVPDKMFNLQMTRK